MNSIHKISDKIFHHHKGDKEEVVVTRDTSLGTVVEKDTVVQ